MNANAELPIIIEFVQCALRQGYDELSTHLYGQISRAPAGYVGKAVVLVFFLGFAE
jgi:hypothetical protein